MTDLQIVGGWLLLVVPLMVVEATAYVPAGFDSAFWALPLAEKLPRIAAEEHRWLRMARVWIVIPVVVAAGLLAGSVVALGVDVWVWLGTGIALVCAAVAVLMFATQGAAAIAAARRGTAPDWLEATWGVLSDVERTYVVGTSVASVLIGIGLTDGAVLGTWVAWSMIAAPGLVAASALITGFFFPHMALLGPLILAVGMMLS